MEAWTFGAPVFLFWMNEPREDKEKGRCWSLASPISNTTLLEKQNYVFLIKTKNNQKKHRLKSSGVERGSLYTSIMDAFLY